MNNQSTSYRFLTLWVFTALLVNISLPGVVNAVELYCQKAGSGHTTHSHPTARCGVDARAGSDVVHTDYNKEKCTLGRACEQELESGLKEVPVVQRNDDMDINGMHPMQNHFKSPRISIVNRVFIPLHANLQQAHDIYLLNRTLLN